MLLGDGLGGFGKAINYPTSSGTGSVAAGDFNGDQILDLAVTNSTSYNVSVLLGNGKGGFAPALNFATGPYPSSVAIGDFNQDQKPDLVAVNGALASTTVSLLLNQSQ